VNGANQMLYPHSMVLNDETNIAFVYDDDNRARNVNIFVVDLNTGERVVLSRWVR